MSPYSSASSTGWPTSVWNFVDYHQLLAADPGEHQRLCEAIPVTLTAFFRDPDDWAFLASRAIPELLAAKPPSEPFRAWSAGCSTGEEAYTLAMLLAEAVGPDAAQERVTVLATDVSEDAITRCRTGRYPTDRMTAVPPALRDRYFRREGTDYEVRPHVRLLVTFGRHDLLRDPPYGNLDLIVCRNTMIYFTQEARSTTLTRLHQSLRPGGLLFTGRAELPPVRNPLFLSHSARHRVFLRIGVHRHETEPSLNQVGWQAFRRADLGGGQNEWQEDSLGEAGGIRAGNWPSSAPQ